MLSIVLKEAQLALSVKKVAVLRLSQRNRSCLEVYQQAQRARIFFFLSNIDNTPSESYSHSICNHLEPSTW